MGACISKTIIHNPIGISNDAKIVNSEYDTTVPFMPPISFGKVIKIYDGDTITIAATLPYAESPIYRFQVRLRGIDTPEIKGKSEEEKKVALIVRDALHEKIFGRIVILKDIGTEKYGRILADIYLDTLHVNKWLIDAKYAVPYDGGKKKEWNA